LLPQSLRQHRMPRRRTTLDLKAPLFSDLQSLALQI
jgi:hypothetical protein